LEAIVVWYKQKTAETPVVGGHCW